MLVEIAIFVYPVFDNLYNKILTWNFPVMDQKMTGIQHQHVMMFNAKIYKKSVVIYQYSNVDAHKSLGDYVKISTPIQHV